MAKTRDALGLVFSLIALVPLWWTLGVAADMFGDVWLASLLRFFRLVLLAGPLIFLYEITQDVIGPRAARQPARPQTLTEQHVADATAAAIEHGVDPALAIAAVAEHLAHSGQTRATAAGQPPPPTGNPIPGTDHTDMPSAPTSVAMKGLKAIWATAAVVASGLLIVGVALAALVIYMISQADCFLGC